MAVTQYVGARYVPLFADPLDWDNERTYEPLTIVYYQGNSYTSRQYVPTGIDISNDEYWALTGNYNAQIEQYRQEVAAFDGRITSAQEAAEGAQSTADAVTTTVDGITPFDTTPTEGSVKGVTSGGVYSALDGFETEVNSSIDSFKSETNATIEEFKGEVSGDIEELTTTVNDRIGTLESDMVMQSPNFIMQGWARFSLETEATNGTNRRSVQGCCWISENSCVVYQDDNTEGTNVQRLSLFTNGNLITSVNVDMGHAGSMGYNEGYLYIANSNDSTIYRAACSVSSLSTPVSTGITYGNGNNEGCGISIIDGQIYDINYHNVSNNCKVKNISTGAIIEQKTITFNDAYTYTLHQAPGAFKYNDRIYIYDLYSQPGAIYFYSWDNENLVGSATLPNLVSNTLTGEIECFSFDPNGSGSFFMSSQEATCPSIVLKTGCVFKGNISHGADYYDNCIIDTTAVHITITNDDDYIFPRKDTAGTSYESDTPLYVYYPQDINGILAVSGINNCTITLAATRTDTALVTNTPANVVIDFDGYTIPCYFYYGQVTISDISAMLSLSSISGRTGATYLINTYNTLLRMAASATSASLGSNFLRISNGTLITTYNNCRNIDTFCTQSSALYLAPPQFE